MIIFQTFISAIVILSLAHLIAGKATSSKTVRELFSWKYLVDEWKTMNSTGGDGWMMAILGIVSVILLVFVLHSGLTTSAENQHINAQCVGGKVVTQNGIQYCATIEQVNAFKEKQKSDNIAFIKSLKLLEQLK